jgi:hypothetical protein
LSILSGASGNIGAALKWSNSSYFLKEAGLSPFKLILIIPLSVILRQLLSTGLVRFVRDHQGTGEKANPAIAQ